jgi:hypothetical protein
MRSKEELKARLMAEYEAALEAMLAEKSSEETISLEEIEAHGMRMQQAVGRQVSQALSEVEEKCIPRCGECGEKMINKGKRSRQVVTQSGEIVVESPYYYCATCRTGFSPSA